VPHRYVALVVAILALYAASCTESAFAEKRTSMTNRSACRTLWRAAESSRIQNEDADAKRAGRLAARLAGRVDDTSFRAQLVAMSDVAGSRVWSRYEFEMSPPVLQLGRACLAAFGKETNDTGPWWGDWKGFTNLRLPPNCDSASYGCGAPHA